MENENDKLISKAYRDYMAEELARPEIAEDKQKLMAFFEAPAAAPAAGFGAGVFAPALLLIGLFFFMHQVQVKAPSLAGPSVPIYQGFSVFMEEARAREQQASQSAASNPALEENPVEHHMKPRVIVKRVSSRVGPTMVYQKTYRNTPVTIIWVFNQGGKAV